MRILGKYVGHFGIGKIQQMEAGDLNQTDFEEGLYHLKWHLLEGPAIDQ